MLTLAPVSGVKCNLTLPATGMSELVTQMKTGCVMLWHIDFNVPALHLSFGYW